MQFDPGSCNGDPDTVETLMSPLDLVKRATQRKQRLTEAQLAHLRVTAYRGVDTSAHLSPTIARSRWNSTVTCEIWLTKVVL